MSRTIKRLVPWFGANTATAAEVGRQMGDPDWACVLFAGGCAELPHIRCRGGVANDLHRHVINLARVISDPKAKVRLAERLAEVLFHPDELAEAQARCQLIENDIVANSNLFDERGQRVFKLPMVEWAFDYFITAWMARGGNAGTEGEFKGGLPIRYDANGGGSNVRYRSAVAALDAWHAECKRWEWTCKDCFDVLRRIGDAKRKAVYADAPWVGAGENYRHKFTEKDHRNLAAQLEEYREARVVVRYGDHPLIRELYREPHWTLREQTSRDQANGGVSELLIVNGPMFK